MEVFVHISSNEIRALTESEQNSVISQSSLMELRGELSTWRSKAVHDL